MSSVRTRFAPSPTGYLHLGGARTALFNYLYARRHGGAFVLRIEDTDRERSRPEYTHAILEGLSWLGLDYDEGPFYQSERLDLYRARVDELLGRDAAYWCFCSAEEVERKRKLAQASGRRPTYDRTCRDLHRVPKRGEAAVVRFRAPLDGVTVVDDLIRGAVRFDNAELDDFVIVRSDGTPTFHLVVVVDDVEMRISHILRGEDHLTNTPRQLAIFRALGAEAPRYGHLPLIVGPDRRRLSKRHGATAVDAYREQGFLPGAVVNYLARLGWAHGDQEIFRREELIALFDLDGINRSAAAFDMEKFAWVNAQHMRMMTIDDLIAALGPFLEREGVHTWDAQLLRRLVELLRERTRTLVELAAQARIYLVDDIAYDERAVAKFLNDANRPLVAELAAALENVEPWDAPRIERAFRETVEKLGLKLGALAQPARVALTGSTASPGIFEVCEVLGKTRTLARLRRFCGDRDPSS